MHREKSERGTRFFKKTYAKTKRKKMGSKNRWRKVPLKDVETKRPKQPKSKSGTVNKIKRVKQKPQEL